MGLPFVTPGTICQLLVDGADNFTIVFQANDENGTGVFVRRFNAAGAAQVNAFRINATNQGNQSGPAAATNAAGDSVVAWVGPYAGGLDADVFAQRFATVATPGSVLLE